MPACEKRQQRPEPSYGYSLFSLFMPKRRDIFSGLMKVNTHPIDFPHSMTSYSKYSASVHKKNVAPATPPNKIPLRTVNDIQTGTVPQLVAELKCHGTLHVICFIHMSALSVIKKKRMSCWHHRAATTSSSSSYEHRGGFKARLQIKLLLISLFDYIPNPIQR